MSTQPKAPVEEVLAAIFEPFDPDPDIELRRVLAMSREEVRASLEARGNDLKALESRARAFLGVAKKSSRLVGLATFVGIPGSAVAAVAAAVQMLAPAASLPANPVVATFATAAAAPPLPEERKLRMEATDACNAQQWRACLDKLDQAKAIDPDGDLLGGIPDLRAQAQDALKQGGGR